MGNADAMPVSAHVRVDSSVVAGFIFCDRGKKKKTAEAVAHADFESRFGFDGQAQPVDPHSLGGRDFNGRIDGMMLSIETELRFAAVH